MNAATDAPEQPDLTRVITRRAVAIAIDALLITVLPVLTVLVVGHAATVRACPDRLPKGHTCVAWRGNGVAVENRSILLFVGFFLLLYVVVFVVVQGRTGATEWMALGFAPRKAALTLYGIYSENRPVEPLFEQLGPHTTAKGCLYIKRLDAVDEDVLEKLILAAWERSRG